MATANLITYFQSQHAPDGDLVPELRYLSRGALGPTLPSALALVGVGDFNGDGNPDYVLYKASTRQSAIWYMNNNVLVSGAYGPTLPAGWTLIGTADFNSDGKTDFVLFNPSTGKRRCGI